MTLQAALTAYFDGKQIVVCRPSLKRAHVPKLDPAVIQDLVEFLDDQKWASVARDMADIRRGK